MLRNLRNPEEIKKQISKYSIILDIPIEELKERLHNLTDNFYLSFLKNDAEAYDKTTEEINKYLELNVPEVTDYLNYCFNISISKILKKIYDLNNVEIYVPEKKDLEFKTFHDSQAEKRIKQLGLSKEEVDLVVKYNIQKMEIYSLQMFGVNIVDLKPNINLPKSVKEFDSLITGTYTKSNVESRAKFYYSGTFLGTEILKGY